MTLILKNLYIDKSYSLVNKYNNTYHRPIKMEPGGVKPSIYTDFNKENNNNNNKVGDNARISTFKNIYKKKLAKTNKKEFTVEKFIKRKGNKLYVKWKDYDNSLNSWIDKNTLYKWVNLFQNRNL